MTQGFHGFHLTIEGPPGQEWGCSREIEMKERREGQRDKQRKGKSNAASRESLVSRSGITSPGDGECG